MHDVHVLGASFHFSVRFVRSCRSCITVIKQQGLEVVYPDLEGNESKSLSLVMDQSDHNVHSELEQLRLH